MLQANPQTTPALQADLVALDALFKRIAERGRKIRTQNKAANVQPLDGDTLTVERTDSHTGKESIHEEV